MVVVDGNAQLIPRTLEALTAARTWLLAQGFPVPELHVVMGAPGAGGTQLNFLGLDPNGDWRLYIPANDLFNVPDPIDRVLYFDLIHEYGHCFAAQLITSGRATALELYGAGGAEHFADNFATMLDYPPARPVPQTWTDTPVLSRIRLLALWARPPGGRPDSGLVIRSAFSYPIPPGGEFGAPRPNGPHTGEDHAMPVGTPLPSLVAGSLADYELDPLGGHEARVTRPNGDVVIFAHCSGIVGPDRLVAQGDLIAYSGNSGTATTGPHVHVEVRVAGMAAPPGPYFHPMDEAEVRRLVRDEVERQYDLANTIAALKALTTKIVTALRALGNL